MPVAIKRWRSNSISPDLTSLLPIPPVLMSSQLPRVSVSFSGCGFLGMFHVGSLACWRDNANKVAVDHALGASVGAIVAVSTLLPEYISVETLKDKFLEVVREAESLHCGAFNPKFNANKIFEKELDRILPENAHEIVSDRLTVSLTDTAMRNHLVSKFERRSDLIAAIVCSCFLPAFSAYEVPTYKGLSFLDGGLSNSLPVLDSKTILISPFAGASHICPKDNESFTSSVMPDNPLTNKIMKSLAGQKMEMSATNVRRLMNMFRPANDLDALFQHGYDLTQSFINDFDQMSRHYYCSISASDSGCSSEGVAVVKDEDA